MSTAPTSIYFVKPIDQAGPIKIGITNDMKVRMQSFTRYSPVRLEMAVSVPGTLAIERSLHERFAYAHSHFEWFHPVDPLVSGIEGLKSGLPIEQAFDLSVKTGSIRKKQPGIMARFTPQYRQRLKYSMKYSHNKFKPGARHVFVASPLLHEVLHPKHSQTFLTAEEIVALDAEIASLMALVKGHAQ